MDLDLETHTKRKSGTEKRDDQRFQVRYQDFTSGEENGDQVTYRR